MKNSTLFPAVLKKSDFYQQISNRKAKNSKFFQDKVFFCILKKKARLIPNTLS